MTDPNTPPVPAISPLDREKRRRAREAVVVEERERENRETAAKLERVPKPLRGITRMELDSRGAVTRARHEIAEAAMDLRRAELAITLAEDEQEIAVLRTAAAEARKLLRKRCDDALRTEDLHATVHAQCQAMRATIPLEDPAQS